MSDLVYQQAARPPRSRIRPAGGGRGNTHSQDGVRTA